MGSLETQEVVLYEVKVDKELEACSNFFSLPTIFFVRPKHTYSPSLVDSMHNHTLIAAQIAHLRYEKTKEGQKPTEYMLKSIKKKQNKREMSTH